MLGIQTVANAVQLASTDQVEIVIAFALSTSVLHERHSRSDYVASALVLAGIVVAVVAVVAVG